LIFIAVGFSQRITNYKRKASAEIIVLILAEAFFILQIPLALANGIE